METHDWLLIVKNTCQLATKKWPEFGHYITNFMGYELTIIVLWNLFFIGLYGIDTNVIYPFVLFEYWCHVHYLDTNVICLFVFFRHRCCMSIYVYTQKSCTRLPCLNNAWHSCLNNTNLWNNIFCIDLEQTHETCKFVMKTPKGFKLYVPRSKSRGEGKGLEGLGQPFCHSKE